MQQFYKEIKPFCKENSKVEENFSHHFRYNNHNSGDKILRMKKRSKQTS